MCTENGRWEIEMKEPERDYEMCFELGTSGQLGPTLPGSPEKLSATDPRTSSCPVLCHRRQFLLHRQAVPCVADQIHSSNKTKPAK